MHVNDATNEPDASNNADDAQSTEISKTSRKKCRLLCKPSELPPSPIPQPNLIDEKDMDYDTKYVIKNFFCDRQRKALKKARDRRWI